MRQRRGWLLGALVFGCLILALGNNGLVYAAVKRVFPLLGFMRYPVKFVMLPAALIPLLGAMFIGHCLSVSKPDWLALRRWIVGFGAVLLAISAFVIWIAFHYPMRGTDAQLAATSAISRAGFLIVILGSLALLRHIKRPGLEKPARLGVLLLLFLDVMTAGPRPNPSVPRWVYEPNLAGKELHLDPMPRPGTARAMLNAEAESNLSVTQMTNGINDVIYRRLALRGNLNILDDIPKLVGMYPLYFRELGEVLPALYAAPQPPTALMDFLSVSYTNVAGKVTEWGFRPTHLPWVSAGQKPVFADGAATLTGLTRADFDPRKTVFLPLETQPLVAVSNSSPVKVSVRRFSPLRIELEVEAAEPAMVVIGQSFYHNWRAYVGGNATRLLRANHAFQALEVPPGRHEVILRYQDRFFYCGALISLASLILWIALWFRPAGIKQVSSPAEPKSAR